MFLPTLDELDLDSMASIPDSLKSLVAQYRAMIANIKEKLGSNPVA